MLRQKEVGEKFAFAFYCPELPREQPASTYAFSELRWFSATIQYLGVSRVANILWRGDNQEAATRLVERKYPRAQFRGIFTDKNFLLTGDKGQEPLKVVGPRIALDDFENGPIRRPEIPNQLGARSKILRLVIGRKGLIPES